MADSTDERLSGRPWLSLRHKWVAVSKRPAENKDDRSTQVEMQDS